MKPAVLTVVLLAFAYRQSNASSVALDEIGQQTLAMLSEVCPDARNGFFHKGMCLLRYLGGLPKMCRPIHIAGTCDGPIIEQLSWCGNERANDYIIHLSALSKADRVLCANGEDGVADLFKEYGFECIVESILSCSNPLLPIFGEFLKRTGQSGTFYSPENCRRMKEVDCVSQLSNCRKKSLPFIRKMHRAYLNATCGPDFVN